MERNYSMSIHGVGGSEAELFNIVFGDFGAKESACSKKP